MDKLVAGSLSSLPERKDQGRVGSPAMNSTAAVEPSEREKERVKQVQWPRDMLPPPLPSVVGFFSPVVRTALAHPAPPTGSFDSQPRPPKPDYRDPRAWAARPVQLASETSAVHSHSPSHSHSAFIPLTAEMVPPSVNDKVPESTRLADCFFVHPTTYFGPNWNENCKCSPGHHGSWDEVAAELTNCWVIATQATVFNGSCRVWAPEYRQASITGVHSQGARDLAYSDVKRAFLYFLRHVDPDAPIVLASHSQGGFHLAHILEEFFEHDEVLRSRLVCAYLVGSRLPLQYFGTTFRNIPEGERPDQTGCIVGWDTITIPKFSSLPKHPMDPLRWRALDTIIPNYPALCTNPVTWAPSSDRQGYTTHSGLWKGSINVVIRKRMPPNDTAKSIASRGTNDFEEDDFLEHEPSWDDIFSPIAVGMDVVKLVDTDLAGVTARSTGRGLEVPHINRKYLGPMGPLQWLIRGWLHCEDYSLFWHNIRDNVALRLEAFHKAKHGKSSSPQLKPSLVARL